MHEVVEGLRAREPKHNTTAAAASLEQPPTAAAIGQVSVELRRRHAGRATPWGAVACWGSVVGVLGRRGQRARREPLKAL